MGTARSRQPQGPWLGGSHATRMGPHAQALALSNNMRGARCHNMRGALHPLTIRCTPLCTCLARRPPRHTHSAPSRMHLCRPAMAPSRMHLCRWAMGGKHLDGAIQRATLSPSMARTTARDGAHNGAHYGARRGPQHDAQHGAHTQAPAPRRGRIADGARRFQLLRSRRHLGRATPSRTRRRRSDFACQIPTTARNGRARSAARRYHW